MDEEQKQPDACASCEEYLAGWKRALADYDNLKKELGRERSDMRRDALISAAESFLPVADHFEAALKFTPEVDAKAKAWLSGILHIRRELEEAMKSLGLEPVGEVGQPFDPAQHDAAGNRSEEGKEPGTILEVVSRGWKMGDRIVRPARVIVNEKQTE